MSAHVPLAEVLRPKTLSQYVGNQDLLGENGVLRRSIESENIPSMILWGPPGTGKTSLVHVIKQRLEREVISLSAITSGVKDIKQIAIDAENQRQGLFASAPIVFVDEIHRFNKSQQDAFLPHVESGLIKLIGATTENPAFSINRALLSRLRVFTLQPLSKHDLNVLYTRAIEHLQQNKGQHLSIENEVKEALFIHANGDARRMLSAIELAAQLLPDSGGELKLALLEQAIGQSIAAFDKQGDHYYDLLSAFHKSIRGSATDAALFWFARMLIANSDVTPICRRLLAIASEDIGNADPKALQVCLNAWDVYHRVGKSEGERAIAQAVIYCALAPKSNATYTAFKAAMAAAKAHDNKPVPFHLRNAPTALAKSAGHGKDYVYPHNEANAYAPGVKYFPSDMDSPQFYSPQPRGFEKQLQQKIAYLQELEDNTRQRDK